MKKRIANWLLKHLFNAITADDVLRLQGEHLMLRGKPLTQLQVEELKSAAATLQRMNLWLLLMAEVKHKANEMIFVKSKTADDLIFAKAVLYAVDVIEQKVNQIAKIK